MMRVQVTTSYRRMLHQCYCKINVWTGLVTLKLITTKLLYLATLIIVYAICGCAGTSHVINNDKIQVYNNYNILLLPLLHVCYRRIILRRYA